MEGREGGLAFVMINIQADSHLEPRLALHGFGFTHIYIIVVFGIYSLYPPLFCKQHVPMHCPLFSNATRLCICAFVLHSCDLGRRGACRGTPRFDQVEQRTWLGTCG